MLFSSSFLFILILIFFDTQKNVNKKLGGSSPLLLVTWEAKAEAERALFFVQHEPASFILRAGLTLLSPGLSALALYFILLSLSHLQSPPFSPTLHYFYLARSCVPFPLPLYILSTLDSIDMYTIDIYCSRCKSYVHRLVRYASLQPSAQQRPRERFNGNGKILRVPTFVCDITCIYVCTRA